MKFNFDVIIIGTSLSGTSAALQLADSGRPVRLIDEASFPRPKPCSETFSDAVEQLDPVGAIGMTHALISEKFAATAIAGFG